MSTRANVYVGDPDEQGRFLGYIPSDGYATGSAAVQLGELGDRVSADLFEATVHDIVARDYAHYGNALLEGPVRAEYEYALVAGRVLARCRPRSNRAMGSWTTLARLAERERCAAQRHEARLVGRYDQLSAALGEIAPHVYLDLARDMLDRPLGYVARVRILELIHQPTADRWNHACGLLIGRTRTLWQAVCAVEPSFPRTGRRTDGNGDILREWEAIPDRDLVLRALRHACPLASFARN